jgi:hypothetical protein
MEHTDVLCFLIDAQRRAHAVFLSKMHKLKLITGKLRQPDSRNVNIMKSIRTENSSRLKKTNET